MYKQISVTLSGLVPLLMHNPRLADPMDPIVQEISKLTGKNKKTLEDRIRIQELEWEGGLYQNDGKLIIPGHVVEGCLKKAAGMNKMKNQVVTGVICDDDCILKFDGSKLGIDKLKADSRYRDVRNAKVQGKMVMRCRPIVRDWSLPVTLSFLPDVINKDQVIDLLKFAGIRCGIGDYTPKYGRFSVA